MRFLNKTLFSFQPCGFSQEALLQTQANYVCVAVFACWIMVSLAGRLNKRVVSTDIASSLHRRRGALAVVNAVGFLGTLVMIRRSFIDRHDFPYAPLFGFGLLEDSPGFLRSWQICNFACLVASLMLVIFAGFHTCVCSTEIDATALRIGARMALCFTFLLLVADMSQCQPYMQYYAATLVDLALQRPSLHQSTAAVRDVAPVLCVFLGLQYTFAGLCKHNACFMSHPVVAQSMPPMTESWVHTLLSWQFEETLAAKLEFMLGLAVLLGTSRLQVVAAVLIAVMHALLIWGLKSHEWNPQVWPWNACGLVTVLLVLAPAPSGGLSLDRPVTVKHVGKVDAKGSSSSTQCLKVVVLLVCGVCPALHILGLPWDSYASMSLYSAEIEQTLMYVNGGQFEDPKDLACNALMPNGFVDYDGWVHASNDFYPYAAPRVFLRHARFIAQRFGANVSVAISGRPKNTLFGRFSATCTNGTQLSRYTCDASKCHPYSLCESVICINECVFPRADMLECGDATSFLQSRSQFQELHRTALRI